MVQNLADYRDLVKPVLQNREGAYSSPEQRPLQKVISQSEHLHLPSFQPVGAPPLHLRHPLLQGKGHE